MWITVLITVLGAGGIGAVFKAIVDAVRDRRNAPAELERQDLANQQTAAGIAHALREEQAAALADIRELLDTSRREAKKGRAEMTAMRVEMYGMQQQIKRLELTLSRTQTALMHALRFIDRLVEWGRNGGHPPEPTPPAALHVYMRDDSWPDQEEEAS